MNRGEVWWLEHPDAGRRPACVLTRQRAIEVLDSVLVVLATRTIRDIPTEVLLEREDGMPMRCVLTLDNVLNVPKALLTGRITRLSPRHMVEVCGALRHATSC